MPDYTSILRRSVAALPDSSPQMREAVYQRARAALARQLTAVDPPLSTREIETQHQELEDAVGRVEAEYAPEEADPDADFSQEEGVSYTQADRAVPAYRDEPIAEREAEDDRAGGEEESGEEEESEFEEEERRSRVPLMIGLLLLVLAIGGIGAYLYSEQDRLLAMFGGSGGEERVAAEEAAPVRVDTPAEPDAAAADDPDKRPDRLTNGSDTPAGETASAEPETIVAPVGGAAVEPLSPDAPVTPLSPDAAVTPQEQETAALQDTGQAIVAQRAIYYFQGTEGSPGRANEGTVTWAQISRDNGPAVQATLRLAEPDVTTTVTIYKNNDSSLPASHLVEVQFTGSIGPSPIQRVPALVLKQTEQARGQPLAGAAVPVTDDLFWIALSDDAEQVTRNIELLRDGSWFDIPILFNDGTRALLTFEKGIPGDRVFETVMSSWTPS